ncbi:filamentous hemagglutinin N-terminal domain-containing protein [Methylorubrum extorquens]|uniref:Filamentous hemagglutinin N-terminal domain-containing protein n=1 Tax=Methylorubrum extorquens TaxID=408 RepID=A0AAX3WF89_METEX|nr:filamentous hemagglutinin N-terminal domain-containing protein [Methylorubrum extorquens]WHQ68594.1 filamentous hemagglutinin N-terminal domain-containing protein [Methylorubrum extorquens]
MNRTCKILLQALLAGTALTQPGLVRAGEMPIGATTVHGSVGIATPSAGQMTIQQTTPTAIVNWQGFSVGAGNRVDIVQPSASSALLNRVTGSAPSTIAGQVNANGQVYLVNPNGITITPTGVVNAGAFVASTLDISDHDFSNGRRVFRGQGQSASVSNQGTIAIRQGGYAALLGGQVDNSGVISVPMGRVGLGAGEQATLDLTGDGFLQVAVPSKGDGSDAALIRHSGRIIAKGGQVVMQAATAREMARNAINLSGLVEARSVGGRNGAIVLGGGEGGRVTVTGRLDASAQGGATRPGRRQDARQDARGGAITVTGHDIRLQGAALLADGQAGGGSIHVGGGYQGKGPLQRAGVTTVDAATTISADAGRIGNGGDVVVWSDISTAFAGRISARGGLEGGNGGQAEVSGKTVLAYSGITDLSAAKGAFGTLLLDPYNITISSGTDANQTGFAATGNDSVINAATLQTALRTANVTVTTGGAGSAGAQAGDITVAAPLTWGTGTGGANTTLTLSAFRSIVVSANLTVNGDGGLALNTNQGGTGGTLSFGPGASASFVGGGSQTLAIDGQPYILLRTAPQLAAALATPATAGGRFALATDADAAGLPAFNRPINSTPQGIDIPFTGTFEGLGHTINGLSIDTAGPFAGLFGITQGATIANINLTNVSVRGRFAGGGGSYVGGLVGRATDTTIRGVTVSGNVVNASSADAVSLSSTGGLAGSLLGASNVQRSFATAAVTGGNGSSTTTGGLLGQNTGSVSQSYATGAVTAGRAGSGFNDTGGLIGQNNGGVSQSFATGTVTGGPSSASGPAGDPSSGSFTGGLIGFNGVSGVEQVYATGAVNGGDGPASNSYTGGLIGYSSSNFSQGYATGRVTGGSSSNSFTGGLVGYSSVATATASFWDTTTTGQPAAAGNVAALPGATGLTTAQFQSAGTFVTLASSQGWDFETVWAPPSEGFYPELYSLSPGRRQPPTRPTDNAERASELAGASVTPNIVSILPNFTTAALGLGDTLDLGGGGPTLGVAPGSGEGGSGTRAGATRTLASIQAASNALEGRLAACDKGSSTESRNLKNCYSDALDGFADTLDIQVQQLPPAFRGLPAVIRQAARQVKAARTVAEARAAVRVAVVAVRKAIALLRADEPAVARIQSRQGNAIASALRMVDNRLSRATGL